MCPNCGRDVPHLCCILFIRIKGRGLYEGQTTRRQGPMGMQTHGETEAEIDTERDRDKDRERDAETESLTD